MKRLFVLLALAAAAGVAGMAGWELNEFFGDGTKPPASRPAGAAEAQVLAAIQAMQQKGDRHFGVAYADGRMLRLLTESLGARNVVEVGTSTGYSALWLALGVQRTGGRLTTFELSPQRAATARTYLKQAGVEDRATVVVGDAHKELDRIEGPVDLVFIDAEKEGYVDYLKKLLPRVRPGGLILAHNIEMAPEYMAQVSGNPALDTVLFMHGGGMAITLKKM